MNGQIRRVGCCGDGAAVGQGTRYWVERQRIDALAAVAPGLGTDIGVDFFCDSGENCVG
jgi:hypothetical protein